MLLWFFCQGLGFRCGHTSTHTPRIHAVANMFTIPLGIALGAKVTVADFLVNNLLPVTVRASHSETFFKLPTCVVLTESCAATLSLRRSATPSPASCAWRSCTQ
jgi:hypothetical protein